MDNQTKVIFVLLALIAILVGIFVLKVTGVIKPAPVEPATNILEQATNTIEENKKIDYIYNSNFERTESFSEKLIYFITVNYVSIIIGVNILSILINIGVGKLYRKLSMPEWTVSYQYIYPFITMISNLLFKEINNIITFVLGIISIVIMSHYFRSVGMSKYWPVLGPAVALPIIGISVSLSFSGSLFGAGNSSSFGATLLLIIAVGMLIAYLIACIIANIKVGILFNRGTLFIIGLVIMPIVFQPILGYWGRIEYVSKHTY